MKSNRQAQSVDQPQGGVAQYLSIARVLIVAIDTRGLVSFINDYGAALLGYKPEELTGRNWFETCLPKTQAKDVMQVYQQLMSGKIEPVEYYENPVRKKDGSQLIVAWRNSLLKDSQGNITGSLSSGNDVTEQHDIKQALEKSERKYRSILKGIEDCFLEVDIKGNFIAFNPSFCKMLGYKEQELSGLNYLEFLDEENAKKVQAYFHEVLTTGNAVPNATWQFKRKDGTARYSEASITLVKDTAGNPIGFRGFGRDITEQKLAQIEIKLAKEEWEQTFDAVPDLIMIVDNHHRIVRMNKSMADRLNRPEEELIGKTCYRLVHGMDKPPAACPHSKLLKDFKFHSVEVEEKALGGDFHVTVSPVRLRDGNITGSVHIAHDITYRKKAERILAENEGRFRDISMSMADWIWETDNHGRYVFAAGNSKKMLGYTNKEIIGKTPFDFMAEEERAKIKKTFTKIAAAKAPIKDLKNWNLKKDGTRVCLLTNGVPILNNQGELTGYRGVDKDITNQLEMEERLKRSLSVTEQIIDNIPIGMVIVKKDKKIKRINNAALELTGYTNAGEVEGKYCHDNICPAEKGQCPITDLGQTLDRSEKTIVRNDGTRIPVYKTALPIDLDGEEVIIEAFMDIRPLKQAEEALRESERRLRTVMETIADPVVVYDTQGRVTYLNPAFTRVFGWHLDHIIGTQLDFVPESEQIQTQKSLDRVLKGETLSGFETRRKTKSNRTIDVRIGAALLLNSLGNPSGMVVNFQDITEEKIAQKELNNVNAELEKAIEQANRMAQKAEIANMAKSEFLANMSHEIRTPLNGVTGMTELLLNTRLNRNQQHYAETIQTSGNALLKIINDILDFSKIEAGKLEIESIEFELRVLLDELGTMMSHRVQQKELEFICAASPEIPAFIMGDPGRLRQVLTNLVTNAIKFTSQGEISVLVFLNNETEEKIELLFTVRDTGIGIPVEKHDILFQSFSQADSSTTRKFGGTGLGLAISKKLCAMMGGQIGLNSDSGKGSEFWFTAWFEKSDRTPAKKQPANQSILKDRKILIVDDNETNREILTGQLGSWGCRTIEASDGPDALRKLYEAICDDAPFDAAILDMHMPVMDGLSLGNIIKSDNKIKSVRMIMMTSVGDLSDSKRFKQAGFAAYLVKPVGHSELLKSLMTLFGDQEKASPESFPIFPNPANSVKDLDINILLAEDNITNQQVATGILENIGLSKVTVVENGIKAVDEFSTGRFQLVLMDIQMPEMDGFEATRQIRDLEAQKNLEPTPVVAMTAHAMAKDRDRCIAAGMNDYLSKPVDSKELIRVLERLYFPDTGRSEMIRAQTPDPAGQPSVPREPIFEKELLLDRLLGDKDLFEKVIKGFLDDMPEQISRLGKLLKEKEILKIQKQGHQIKGAAQNMSAPAFSDAAFRIETAAKNKDLDEISRLFPELENRFQQLKSTLIQAVS